LDLRDIRGTTVPSANGVRTQFERPLGPNAARAVVIGVPENQARVIVSSGFVQGLRTASERLKVFPIIRVVRTWTGRSR
jgi:hypothetical protein